MNFDFQLDLSFWDLLMKIYTWHFARSNSERKKDPKFSTLFPIILVAVKIDVVLPSSFTLRLIEFRCCHGFPLMHIP